MTTYEAVGTKVWRHATEEDSVCVAECSSEEEAQETAITFALEEYSTGKAQMQHKGKLS